MAPMLPAVDVAREIRREVERTQLRARKGISLLARRPPPQVGVTPKDEVWSLGKAKLWRYRSPEPRIGPPVMLFLGLVGDPGVFDLHPGNSWAQRLVDGGFDVYLFDWGRPDSSESDHTLDTYLNEYFVHAVEAVRRTSGASEVSLGAYCMGALMALLLLGSRTDLPVRNLVLFAPPCDYEHSPAFISGLRDGRLDPRQAIDDQTGLVPETAVRAMFRLLQPASDLVQFVTLWENLWREDYIEPHRAVNHWAWSHRAMAGPAFIEMVTSYVRDNDLVTGTARLGSRPVRLQSIVIPTLIVIAERDEFVPPKNSEALLHLLGSSDLEALWVPGGHAGALMGSTARRRTMPGVVQWLTLRADPNGSTADVNAKH